MATARIPGSLRAPVRPVRKRTQVAKVPTASNVSEAAFQAAVLQYAHLRQWRSHHEYDSRRSTPGYPDLTLTRIDKGSGIGRLVYAELKTDKGRVRKEQREWLRDLATVPCVEVYLWRPRNWPEIEKLLY